MFRKSGTESQMDLFPSPEMFLGKRANKSYADPKRWHNVFFKEVTSRIDEDIFSVLYKEGNMGAPTASVRVLVAMSILKEGFGCCDEDLFEKVEFDLLVRKAPGLVSLDDVPPSPDTYYLFNRRLCHCHECTGIDLMEKCFEGITGQQVRKFNISGKSVRMDSKLIGSNIARYSRYEIILRTIQKTLARDPNMAALNPALRKRVVPFMDEKGDHTVYTSDASTLSERISKLGHVIYDVLKRLREDAPGYALLHRVFHEQYRVEGGTVTLRDKREIRSDNLQNPNDPDAEYRNKGDQKVQGYSVNITETVEDGKPSLITSVQVSGATASDCGYVVEVIEKTKRVTGQKVESLYADGAYKSPENREFAGRHVNGHGEPMRIKTGRMQGGSRFVLRPVAGGDDIEVNDTRTDTVYTGILVGTTEKRGRRWRIKIGDGYWRQKPFRYFEEKDLAASLLRQETEGLPAEEQQRRNNVEAAMFQYSFHTKNNKTRYRGLFRHSLQALRRCAWMNMRRLAIYISAMTPGEYMKYCPGLIQDILAAVERICRPFIHPLFNFRNQALSEVLDFWKPLIQPFSLYNLKYATF